MLAWSLSLHLEGLHLLSTGQNWNSSKWKSVSRADMVVPWLLSYPLAKTLDVTAWHGCNIAFPDAPDMKHSTRLPKLRITLAQALWCFPMRLIWNSEPLVCSTSCFHPAQFSCRMSWLLCCFSFYSGSKFLFQDYDNESDKPFMLICLLHCVKFSNIMAQ